MPTTLHYRCLFSTLDRGSVLQFTRQAREMANLGAVDILINSRGGSIAAALGLLRFLEAFPGVEITTYNMEHCDSAAVLLFLAGQRRICRSDASFFLHSLQIPVLRRQTANSLRRELRMLRRETAAVVEEFRKRTVLPAEKWRRMLNDAGTHLDARAALDAGLATELADPALEWRTFDVF